MWPIAAALLVVLAALALRGIRWAYVAFVVISLLRIPSRTGFRLHTPICEIAITMASAEASLTNYPHIVLFALFFAMTSAQLRPTRAGLAWAAVATIVLGLIVELEQGATRTGNCQLGDLIPDALGALVGALAVLSWRRVRAVARPRL